MNGVLVAAASAAAALVVRAGTRRRASCGSGGDGGDAVDEKLPALEGGAGVGIPSATPCLTDLGVLKAKFRATAGVFGVENVNPLPSPLAVVSPLEVGGDVHEPGVSESPGGGGGGVIGVCFGTPCEAICGIPSASGSAFSSSLTENGFVARAVPSAWCAARANGFRFTSPGCVAASPTPAAPGGTAVPMTGGPVVAARKLGSPPFVASASGAAGNARASESALTPARPGGGTATPPAGFFLGSTPFDLRPVVRPDVRLRPRGTPMPMVNLGADEATAENVAISVSTIANPGAHSQ